MAGTETKSFDSPDETRTPPKGRVEIVNLGDFSLGRVTFEPGWKWSESVKPIVGTESCQFNHVGSAIQGRLRVRLDDGSEVEIKSGEAYRIPAGHDAEVVGDENFVAFELVGETLARFAKA